MALALAEALCADPGRAIQVRMVHCERPRWDRDWRQARGIPYDTSLPIWQVIRRKPLDPDWVPLQRTWLRVEHQRDAGGRGCTC